MRFTQDGFLGGRVVARQPAEGFRSGTDAVMLAAAVPAKAGDELLELGCGVGVAALCVAARVADCRLTGIEIAPGLVERANENVRANPFGDSVHVEHANVFRLPSHLRRSFDHVFCNPPFHAPAGEVSPNADRARALSDSDGLGNWIAAGFARVASSGTLTVILRADRLAEALQGLPQQGVSIFPLWPRSGEAAKRVILHIQKDSRAPVRLLGGLVLHERDGGYTPEAEAVLRDGASLALANSRL
ncbi:MAG TPA: methyltransferase [Rhizomicrobium sp.]|jgi:tRNA1(Val) A37 N6-methylase TrmN6|nr:methyltransferase [Rhizomicrobium sp.]